MRKLKYFFLMLIIFFSCSSKEDQINNGSTFFPWKCSDLSISSLFEYIEYISLEAHPDGLIRNADKLIIHDNKYFIFDYMGQNQVNVFDRDGHFLYKIGRKGRGPGEYIEIRNFAIYDDYIYLIDNRINKLLIYNNKNGDFIEDKILPFYAHDMEIGDNGNYIFAQQRIQGEKPAKFQRYNIFITTQDVNIEYSLFPFQEEDCGILSQLYYFTKTDDHIVFRTMVSDSIILFDRKSPSNIYSAYYVDFGDKSVPKKYENEEGVLDEYNWLYSTPNMSSKYMTGNYWVGKNYGYDPYIYIYQKEEAFVENKDISQYFFSPLYCMEDTIYSLYDKAYFDLWIKNNKIPELPDEIINQLDKGDDVLIKYVLK